MNKTSKKIVIGTILITALLLMQCKKKNDDDVTAMAKYLITHYSNIDKRLKFTVDVYGIKYEGITNEWIDDRIMFFGAYEKHLIFFLRDTVKNIAGQNGVFIDVGANTGQHSMFMSQFVKQVYSFDPYEPVLLRFRRMIKLNNIKNIKIFPVGLGDKNQMLKFYPTPDWNTGLGTFAKEYATLRGHDKVFFELPIRVGDDVIEKNNIKKIDIIKIDIEGYERVALRGMKKSLIKHRPVVVMELNHKGEEGITSEEQLLSLFPENYIVRGIGGDPRTGSYELKEIGKKYSQMMDVVIYPAEKKDSLPKKLKVKSLKELKELSQQKTEK